MAYLEEMLPRILVDNQRKERNAENVLKEMYSKVFESGVVEKIGVINILTVCNDYKKLYVDLKAIAAEWRVKHTYISDVTDIQALVKMSTIKSLCRKKGLLENALLQVILGVLDVISLFLTLWATLSTAKADGTIILPNMGLLSGIFIALSIVLSLLFISITVGQNRKLMMELNEWEEDKLIELFEKLGLKGSRLTDDGIYFVKNLSKLDKLCRCYVIAYFRNVDSGLQVWCVLDYIYEDTSKFAVGSASVHCDTYRLQPLSYEEKEKMYYKYNLQSHIEHKYLNFIGVDIFFSKIQNDYGMASAKNYIEKQIRKKSESSEETKVLARFLFCIVYMSVKYECYFSMEQILQWVQNKEQLNGNFKELNNKARKRIGAERQLKESQIRNYFEGILESLQGYYFVKKDETNGKCFKFSEDIFGSMKENLDDICPAEDAVRFWVLIKLIAHTELATIDCYFFECSNLLLMCDFLEKREFITLAERWLHALNSCCCWHYYGPILQRMDKLCCDSPEYKEMIQTETVKRAIENNLLFLSDDESLTYGMCFGETEKTCYWPSRFPGGEEWKVVESRNEILAAWYILMDKVFCETMSGEIRDFVEYEEIAIPSFEKMRLYSICRNLLNMSIDCLKKNLNGASFRNYQSDIRKQIRELPKGAEALTFKTTIEELLLWIEKELSKDENRELYNINAGMLIENTDSSMLHFIYILLNMGFVYDEAVYDVKNRLMSFVIRSIFLFNIMAYDKSVDAYVANVISSKFTEEFKMILLLFLLIRNVPDKKVISKYALEHKSVVFTLITGKIQRIQNELDMEDFLDFILLCNNNMESDDFTRELYGKLCDLLSNAEHCDSLWLQRMLRVVLKKEWPDVDIAEMVDEINKITSCSFATWILDGCCAIKAEMLERLPSVRLQILRETTNTIGKNLMVKYLLRHGYYDCNSDIREAYFEEMRNCKYPRKSEIRKYCFLLDLYEKDNSSAKSKEMHTYNRFVSLELRYMMTELQRQKEGNHPQKTVEFVGRILTCLRALGWKLLGEDDVVFAYAETNAELEKDEQFEEYIMKKFYYKQPLRNAKSLGTLDAGYYIMIKYITKHTDTYEKLRQQAVRMGREVINPMHILQLVEVFIDSAKEADSGYDMESLMDVRDALMKIHNIKHSRLVAY